MASRGEVWLVHLDPIRGHEQAGQRPALIISTDVFNHGPAGLVVLVPMTTRERRIPLHIPLDPPEGGVSARSFIKCEDVRSVSSERLIKCWGSVSDRTLALVADGVRILLEL